MEEAPGTISEGRNVGAAVREARVGAEGAPGTISEEPVSVLFDTAGIKGDVWEIDIVKILHMLARILDRDGRKDLRVAGMAALSSSLIYRMKVESIFALQRAGADKRRPARRRDVKIQLVNMPYRHESTYPVTLDDLLGLLENLITSMANPKNSRRGLDIQPAAEPDFAEYMISLEDVIAGYESLIMKKVNQEGWDGTLQDVVAELGRRDAIRCFFAMLFLARDGRLELEQDGDEIRIRAA